MDLRGEKAALDEAIAEARQRELQELPRQLGLFGEEQTETAEHEQNGTALATRGPGRPLGSRNKRTDEAARFYIGLYGDWHDQYDVARRQRRPVYWSGQRDDRQCRHASASHRHGQR